MTFRIGEIYNSETKNSMGENGDDDYMGDLSQFLPPDEIATLQTKEVQNEAKGYKRKLNWKEKRKIKREEQQKEEDEQVKKGFDSAIPSTNIGFKMLHKMGYNPGVALGKHGQGRLEPVTLEIKRSRTGLGRDDVEKEQQMKQAREMERILQKMKMKEARMMSDFGERKKQLWQGRKIFVNYKKAKAALSQLEETKLGHPIEVRIEKDPEQDAEETAEEAKLRRPIEVKKEKDPEEDAEETAEDEEEEEVTAEDLEEVLNRLRTEFHYCLYCGCQYESEDALLSNCPGTEEEDH